MLTDVPSRSMTIAFAKPTGPAQFSFEYASADDAKRAATAVTAAGADLTLVPALRALARDTQPAVKGRFVNLRVNGKVLADEMTMKALQDWIERKKAALNR
jgi:hypothetical protein